MDIEYINVEGWEDSARRFNLTPLVRVGDVILISGASGGSDSLDPEEQFTAAFDDVAETLAAANATWDDVVKMTTYHQGGLSRHLDVLLRVKDHFVKPPYPAWTGVGVSELANPHALVEIDVIAIASNQQSSVGADTRKFLYGREPTA